MVVDVLEGGLGKWLGAEKDWPKIAEVHTQARGQEPKPEKERLGVEYQEEKAGRKGQQWRGPGLAKLRAAISTREPGWGLCLRPDSSSRPSWAKLGPKLWGKCQGWGWGQFNFQPLGSPQ